NLSTKSLPDVVVGDHVRISLDTNTSVRKNMLVRKGNQINWSKEIYKVKSISEPQEIYLQPLYTVIDPESTITIRLTRAQLLKVNPDKLIHIEPINRRVELSSGQQRVVRPIAKPPPTQLEERAQRPRRQ